MSDSEDEFMLNNDGQSDDSDFDFDSEHEEVIIDAPKKKASKATTANKTKSTALAKTTKKTTSAKTKKAVNTKPKTATKKQTTISIDDIDDDDDDDDDDDSDDKLDANRENEITRPVLSERCINSDESDLTSTKSKSTAATAKKRLSNSKKTVEERYQKLTQLEHILVRPDTYSEYYYHTMTCIINNNCQ